MSVYTIKLSFTVLHLKIEFNIDKKRTTFLRKKKSLYFNPLRLQIINFDYNAFLSILFVVELFIELLFNHNSLATKNTIIIVINLCVSCDRLSCSLILENSLNEIFSLPLIL